MIKCAKKPPVVASNLHDLYFRRAQIVRAILALERVEAIRRARAEVALNVLPLKRSAA